MSRQATTRKEIPEEALLDGVSEWMRPSLERFIAQKITGQRSIPEVRRSHYASMSTVNSIERYLQVKLEQNSSINSYGHIMQYINDDEKCLDIIEAILATDNHLQSLIVPLNEIFTSSGSKWMAVMQESGRATLEERVSDSAQNAFAMALQESDATTQHFLKTAWGKAFGRNPDASSAYSNAIKAIEASAWPIITPNDNKATLGTMLGELRSNLNKWTASIVDKNENQGITAIKDIMQLIWDGQTDRHGTAQPISPSQNAAEQSVLYAVVICNFFNRQLVLKK